MMDERATALLTKMAHFRLFVISWHGSGRDLSPHLAAHLDYMISLEKAGHLFASGPLGDQSLGNGMTIVRATSVEQAEAFAAADPFIRAELRTYSIETWTVMEGRMSVSIDLSDRSMALS